MANVKSGGRVAVVGGGIAGIVSAKECRAAGLQVVGFEADKALGGLWNPECCHSHIWPSMKLNTSRRMVCFSDYPIPEPEGCDPFPTHPEYNRYLHSYVDHFGVRPLFRMGERVTKVEHSESGKWSVTTLKGPVEGEFDYVVVCVGNYVNPFSPEIPGSKSFKGKVIHACEVKNNSFKGKNVLIQGSNISGTQLASIAAAVGKHSFHSQRTPRYQAELYAGPYSVTEFLFSRWNLWSAPYLSPETKVKTLKAKVKNPGDVGGPNARADDDPFVAGVTVSYRYVSQMAEGKITAKPAIEKLEGNRAYFADGSEEEIDLVVQATGFKPPQVVLEKILPKEIMTALGDNKDLNVYKWTWAPDFPGIAFCGLQRAMGSVIPVAELQARWIAAVFSGARKLPMKSSMEPWMQKHQMMKSQSNKNRITYMDNSMGGMMEEIAAEVGCQPSFLWHPFAAYNFLCGPMFPAQYRIDGPGSVPGTLELVNGYVKHPMLRNPKLGDLVDVTDPCVPEVAPIEK